MKLDCPVEELKGIGTKRKEAFNALGIFCLEDMLYFLPRKYKDLTKLTPLISLKHGDECVAYVTALAAPTVRRIRKGLSIVDIKMTDGTGQAYCTWFNQPYAAQHIREGGRYFIYGKVDSKTKTVRIMNPVIEKASEIVDENRGLLAIYPQKQGLTQKIIRECVRHALSAAKGEIEELLPQGFLKKYDLCDKAFAIENIHFPKNMNDKDIAIKRLVFEEMLLYQLVILYTRNPDGKAKVIELNEHDQKAFEQCIGFEMTDSQKKISSELLNELSSGKPMARLLQGDVGSGKTILAFLSMYAAAKKGFQSILLAPTEILAEQHYRNASILFDRLGITVRLLRGGMRQKERTEALSGIATGECDIVIGTHTILQDDVEFSSLALVITDEQHRFGVKQRAKLMAKGESPHMLFISATPIPRTLALILYGDLSLSVIEGMPKGRLPVKTYVVPEHKRKAMYDYISESIKAGSQTYIVSALIDPNEDIEARPVTEIYSELKKGPFKEIETALLHGRLKNADKEAIINGFIEKRYGAIVATSLIEVGIDVKDADIMVIEEASRFGLAQLHQLRGRVGRGSKQSYCYLLPHNAEEAAVDRIKMLASTNDGFKIAEYDLEHRGPGEILGDSQHGYGGLRMANLVRDMAILKQTQDIAKTIIGNHQNCDESYNLLQAALEKYKEKLKDIAMN